MFLGSGQSVVLTGVMRSAEEHTLNHSFLAPLSPFCPSPQPCLCFLQQIPQRVQEGVLGVAAVHHLRGRDRRGDARQDGALLLLRLARDPPPGDL